MKIIITETHFEKLNKFFDKSMSDYVKLESDEREYYTDDWGYYSALAFYKDIDEDWEDDEFVFKIFDAEDGDGWNLEYYGWELKSVINLFGKEMFEKLLKPWFEKTYDFKIVNLYEV